jgi:hypothetical protein
LLEQKMKHYVCEVGIEQRSCHGSETRVRLRKLLILRLLPSMSGKAEPKEREADGSYDTGYFDYSFNQ